MDPVTGESQLEFRSGVSAFDGTPFVMVQWARETGQLTPDEADQHAVAVIQAAQAARHDAAIVAELQESLNLPREVAVAFLHRIRERLDST